MGEPVLKNIHSLVGTNQYMQLISSNVFQSLFATYRGFLWHTSTFYTLHFVFTVLPNHSHLILRKNELRKIRWTLVLMSLYRWCTVVSGHWNMMNPRLKMSGVIIFQCRTNDGASCFVVWPTTSLKLYIVFWDGSETRLSIVCHLKTHTDLITVRG